MEFAMRRFIAGLRRSPTRFYALHPLALALVVPVMGCATLMQALEPPPPEVLTITYRMPIITPVEGSQQAIAKGGVNITATPTAYVEMAGVRTTETETGRSVVCRRLENGIQVQPVRNLLARTLPTYTVGPERLVFDVKISNQLSRVFRGAGSVVQFNVGGSLVSVPQAQYADLANLILPPRSDADVRIAGPLLSTLTEGATIGLFLYDVVTDIDVAGNVTEKQNFEWYYTYRSDPVSRQGTVETTRRQEPVGQARMSTVCR
jgi:hypothetical protein